MTSRDGMSRQRLRQTAPLADQVLTPLGRAPISTPLLNPLNATANSATVIQNSGTVRARHPISNTSNNNSNNNNANLESDFNSIVDVGTFETVDSAPPTIFDADKFRADIKAKRLDSKGLEESILKAIHYLLTTSKRSSQPLTDFTVLPFLAWTVSLHADIFRTSSILKAMCMLLKGSTLIKSIKTFSTVNNGNNNNSNFDTTTPYTLVCQILWAAYKVRR